MYLYKWKNACLGPLNVLAPTATLFSSRFNKVSTVFAYFRTVSGFNVDRLPYETLEK